MRKTSKSQSTGNRDLEAIPATGSTRHEPESRRTGTAPSVRFVLDSGIQIIDEDATVTYCRATFHDPDGNRIPLLMVRPTKATLSVAAFERLSNEYGLRQKLDGAWAVRPLELQRQGDWDALLLEDTGDEPLERLLSAPLCAARFLNLAIGAAVSVGEMHAREIVHGDLKPAHLYVDEMTNTVRLTGFGIARQKAGDTGHSRLAGTLAYMSPEQTGRLNRSVDLRSDLYNLGVVFYRMLTGKLPFFAATPMEWIHSHTSRQPKAPHLCSASISPQLSAIVMRLLEKVPEDRYQSAAGLESDLRRCMTSWTAHGSIRPFDLGEADLPERFSGPSKLYGREQEIVRLRTAVERTTRSGVSELLMVSGYSGVGKSSVVHELLTTLSAFPAMLARGKCDQHKRDVPYAALAAALKEVVKQLLTRHEEDVGRWRDAVRRAVGANGGLVTELVPELTLLVGEQPVPPKLSLQEAKHQFRLVLLRFIQVVATEGAPLVLFLDDLQWADAATLDLIDAFVGAAALRHVVLIGAFRDNEVGSAHPLALKLAEAKATGTPIDEIRIAPLSAEQVGSLVGDVLHASEKRVESFARIVHAKTGGNPFFAIQFLHTLADQNVLAIDSADGRWSWDIRTIKAAAYTANVADLMSTRLKSLPHDCKRVLGELACMGNSATAQRLSIVGQTNEDAVHAALGSAVKQELVERVGGSYRFSHDRVQEAAYSLTPERARIETHQRAGRLLLPHLPNENDDGLIFEIAGQFNRALGGMTSSEERGIVAELNLRAGIRAKRSGAYTEALHYLSAGTWLAEQDRDEQNAMLRFRIELEIAECEFLSGKPADAERRLASLSAHAVEAVDKALVACLRIDVCTALDQNDHAVSIALEYLRHVGIVWSSSPSAKEVENEYEQIRRKSAGFTLDDIVNLPPMTDPVTLGTVEVLTRLQPPAMFTDANLDGLVTCKAVSLCLEAGNCEASCVAYVTLIRVAGPRFADFDTGFRFAKAGHTLSERDTLNRFHGRASFLFAVLTMRWIKHIRVSDELIRGVFHDAQKTGDLLFASWSCNNLISNLLFSGEPLRDLQHEALFRLDFAKRARYGLIADIISKQLSFIRSMQGLTGEFGSLHEAQADEHDFEAHLDTRCPVPILRCWYWIRKMQARYLAGDYEIAAQALENAQSLLWTTTIFIEEAEFHFYAALTLAALCSRLPLDERAEPLQSISRHLALLNLWAANCPDNFEDRAALVGAELARLEGRILDAEHLYERAIQSARASHFPHQEALSSELAARFHGERGFSIISSAYLRNARYCYLRWGATGKLRQIDRLHPHLGEDKHDDRHGDRQDHGAHDTNLSQMGDLDLGVLIDVSQRVSSEIVLEKVIDTFMQAVLTHAGADRGLLILLSSREPRIEAEASSYQQTVAVTQESAPADGRRLPMTVLNYVFRTRETVLIDDVAVDPLFGSDPYISLNRIRAMLCIPLVRQGQLTGALYLENRLTPEIFAAPRAAVLKVLASQVAITLENARLYRELSDREARIRRLVDANIIGIFIFSLDGTLLEANSAFLDLLGYSRENLQRRELNWRNLTPVEWLADYLEEYEPILRNSGVLTPFEIEYFRRDGSRVPVLVGVAMFEPGNNEGVGFVLDLSENKRAEAEARENEARYLELQRELAHANRVTTVGHLAATISHEVKQPIAAMAANADAGLRWLSAQSPNVARARTALESIVRDAMRAGDISDRIRTLVRNAPLREESVDMNAAILEVLFMTRRDAEKHGIEIETQLADPAPLVIGDRVLLQQVMLNLTVNAIEAMSAVHGGHRRLLIETATTESAGVDIRVSDSGPGVEPALLQRLFEPFFTTKETGMGVGLAVAQSVIQAHGGQLNVMSRESSGTTFHITLPT